MKELVNCNCNLCHKDIDWNDDNGYRYILDELVATRAHIDAIINVLEKRIEKDAVINEVLNTDYPDEDVEEDNKKHTDKVLDDLLKELAVRNAMNSIGIKNTNRRTYPWWSIYPHNTTTWF